MATTTLLSTSYSDKSNMEFAAADVRIDCLPFTTIKSIIDESTKNEIALLSVLPVNVVFTSVNAIKALCENIKITNFVWNVYCLEGTTKEAVIQCFGSDAIKGTAPDAKGLSKVLLQQKDIKTVYFFCGDIHLDTLPNTLRQNVIEVCEIVVYSTMPTPHAITTNYDGILFYSPSAVNSFFGVNQIPAHTVLFAIGETTAAAIKKCAANKVVISSAPSKHTLITEAVSYFAALKQQH